MHQCVVPSVCFRAVSVLSAVSCVLVRYVCVSSLQCVFLGQSMCFSAASVFREVSQVFSAVQCFSALSVF